MPLAVRSAGQGRSTQDVPATSEGGKAGRVGQRQGGWWRLVQERGPVLGRGGWGTRERATVWRGGSEPGLQAHKLIKALQGQPGEEKSEAGWVQECGERWGLG